MIVFAAMFLALIGCAFAVIIARALLLAIGQQSSSQTNADPQQ